MLLLFRWSFFFFKQKTAYEVRISDWSSDVCSSDLVRLQPIGLCYLKAAVKKHLPDVEIAIKDYRGGCGRETVAVPKELKYLTDYYPVADQSPLDRKSVALGKGVSVRVDSGGGRIIKKKKININ